PCSTIFTHSVWRSSVSRKGSTPPHPLGSFRCTYWARSRNSSARGSLNASGPVWHGRRRKVRDSAALDADSIQSGSPRWLACPYARRHGCSASLGPPFSEPWPKNLPNRPSDFHGKRGCSGRRSGGPEIKCFSDSVAAGPLLPEPLNQFRERDAQSPSEPEQ